jgi:hypothetical protein
LRPIRIQVAVDRLGLLEQVAEGVERALTGVRDVLLRPDAHDRGADVLDGEHDGAAPVEVGKDGRTSLLRADGGARRGGREQRRENDPFHTHERPHLAAGPAQERGAPFA